MKKMVCWSTEKEHDDTSNDMMGGYFFDVGRRYMCLLKGTNTFYEPPGALNAHVLFLLKKSGIFPELTL
jgi:hypothetical protein